MICHLGQGDDVLACFPTGYGKSMIFHIMPRVQHSSGSLILQTALSIKPTAVVASPLLSLMRDQVASSTEHGVTPAMIGASLFEDEQIQRGDVSVVFGSPQMLSLEECPPTESIPRSRCCCCCRQSSLRRSVVSQFLLTVLMSFEWN